MYLPSIHRPDREDVALRRRHAGALNAGYGSAVVEGCNAYQSARDEGQKPRVE